MSCLLAIEGADGVGKHTAAHNVRKDLEARGISATVISFPRYRETVGGLALGEFLSGRTPIPVSPRAAAVLYGLDRMESMDLLRGAMATFKVVILDRYIASNMVYQASKVPQEQAAEFMRWIWTLETVMFGVEPPHLSIYLDAPLDHAQRLMLLKDQRSYTDRQYDEHEADLDLQDRVRHSYQALAAKAEFGPWRVVHATQGDRLRPPEDISAEIVLALQEMLDEPFGQKRRMIA